MWKKYLWVVHILFVLCFSYLAARIIQTVVLSKLPKADLLETARTETPTRGYSTKSLNTYSLVSRKNIFNSESSGETAAGRGGRTNEPLKKTELNIKLVGTIVGSRQNSFAIIEDATAQKQDLYQIDDVIQDQARILEIVRCRVVVLREGQQEVLECPDQEESAKGAAKPASAGAPASSSQYSGIKKLSETSYVIDEREVENALNNINQLMTEVRVVPNFEDGKTTGFKVFAIKPNSIFAQIGLKNGDVIQKVNDRDITTPDKAFQAFQDLRNERNLTIQLSRGSQQQTLNYEIR
jgi:general secretion pathway protein C